MTVLVSVRSGAAGRDQYHSNPDHSIISALTILRPADDMEAGASGFKMNNEKQNARPVNRMVIEARMVGTILAR